GKAAQMTVKDSNGAVIESVSAETLSAEYDTWYTYKLIYHNGRYYRSFCEKGGEGDIALIAELVSDYGMSRFDFTAAAGTTLGNGESANICLDNTKVYMNVEIAKLVLNVTDEDGNPIVSPKITINGAEYSGNRSGVCSAELFAGVYDVSVCADGYEDKRLTVSVYKSSVEKTIALSKTFVPLEGIAFEKETLALKEGQSGKVTAVTVPADATEQEIVYSSSDESVAAVDADGNVTAAAPGTAVITAASAADEAITAECTVTVYAGNYESVVTSIEIAAPEKAYISNTAVANEVRLTAQAYDQNGVAMEAEFSWLANVSGVTVNNGVLSIPATVKPGRCAVMAKSGGVSSKIAYIELVSITDGVDIIAEETLEEELNIVQGTSDTVQTIGDITYHSGARSGGGEAATGFYIGAFDNRQCLRAKAGRWASAEREAYFVFDKVTADSVYESGRDYVFETDIYFDGTEKLTFNSYSDGYGTALMQVDAGILGLEQKTWYHYILIYSEGKYSQYVIDGNGSFVSVPEPVVTGGSMIAQVHFLQGDESAASIYLAGTRYYTTDYATSDITVRVTDGVNAIPGASVTVAGIEAKTGENGAAVFTLPIGIYNISAVYGSVSGSAKAVSAGENVTYTIMLETADEPPVPSEPPAPEISAIDSVAGSVITVTAAESGLKLYAAKYDGGALARINVFDASVGTAEFAAEFEPDKVFLWDGDMKPIDIWIK
ncbi:MAG: Ig-like domain-containing protein, partial [Candidatus Ornithomonoglobus sp.]